MFKVNSYFFNLLKEDLKRKGKDHANEFKTMIKDIDFEKHFTELKKEMTEFDFDKHFDDLKNTFNHKQSDMTRTPSKDGTYSYLLEVPGFAKSEIDITLDKGVLKVKGDNTKKQFNFTLAAGDDVVSNVTLELGILTINMTEVSPKTSKIKID